VIARRHFALALGAGGLAASLGLFAQPAAKIPRIGFLVPETLAAQSSQIDALRAGLRDYGYVEGKNIAFVLRSADGNYDRLAALAAELVNLRVDIIVTFGTKAVSAAKLATASIPIVDPVMGDPVAAGLSSSLARPGGNVTGTVQFAPESAAKRLEFLKDAAPRITHVAVLVNPANTGTPLQLHTMQATADALKLTLQAIEIRTPGELGATFATMPRLRIEAIVVASDTLFRAKYTEIADLAKKQKLPSTGPKELATAGGLIGYGVDNVEIHRRAAYFVDRILRGAKPDDLPIERATKLDLVINLKTARALGITIPQSLLVRADEVIQ
jgi:putative ABC transport system substrate-binding protein